MNVRTGEIIAELVDSQLDRDVTYVEIGVFEGASLRGFCDNLAHDIECFAIDPFIGYKGAIYHDDAEMDDRYDKILEEFAEEIEDGRVTIVRQSSIVASKRFEDGCVDVVFVDGDHTKDGVSTDIDAWLPKLVDDGILCGHDYCDNWGGLCKVVDELGKTYNLSINRDTTFWWIKKDRP